MSSLQQSTSFITSLKEHEHDQFETIKKSYISLPLNKNLQSISEQYDKLNSVISSYPNKMDTLLKGHEQDFFKAYKVIHYIGTNV